MGKKKEIKALKKALKKGVKRNGELYGALINVHNSLSEENFGLAKEICRSTLNYSEDACECDADTIG